MSSTLIKVEGLSKKFCTSLKRSMLYGTYDAVRDMAGISYDAEQLRKKEFWALQDVVKIVVLMILWKIHNFVL